MKVEDPDNLVAKEMARCRAQYRVELDLPEQPSRIRSLIYTGWAVLVAAGIVFVAWLVERMS